MCAVVTIVSNVCYESLTLAPPQLDGSSLERLDLLRVINAILSRGGNVYFQEVHWATLHLVRHCLVQSC